MKVLWSFEKIVLVMAICCSLASADSIQLRSGRHLHGKYMGGTTSMIGFMTSSAVEYFPTSDVLALMFDDSGTSPLNGLQPNRFQEERAPKVLPELHRTSARPRKRDARPKSQANPIHVVPVSVTD